MGLLRTDDAPAGTRYRMREKIFAIGDDFWIETEDGERAQAEAATALDLARGDLVSGVESGWPYTRGVLVPHSRR
jgi:hypothetical protein